MAQIALIRKKQVTIPTRDGKSEIIVNIRGLGSADFLDFSLARAQGRAGDSYKVLMACGVEGVVAGLVIDSEDGEVFNVKRHGNLADYLSPKQLNELGAEIIKLSTLDDDAKKE